MKEHEETYGPRSQKSLEEKSSVLENLVIRKTDQECDKKVFIYSLD